MNSLTKSELKDFLDYKVNQFNNPAFIELDPIRIPHQFSLKEDIETARQNDFGRKLFESFASEYANSYLNEKSETAKLLKVVDTKNRQLAEAKNIVDKTTTLTEAKDAEIKKINESVQRSKIMNDLIAPLGNDQREIMSDLLESVQTPKLDKAFNKYLSAVIDGNGCESLLSAPLQVIHEDLPKPTLSINDNIVCYGSSIVLSASSSHSLSSSVTYNWFKGNSTTPFASTSSSTYTITSSSTDYISGNFSVTTSLSGCSTSENLLNAVFHLSAHTASCFAKSAATSLSSILNSLIS